LADLEILFQTKLISGEEHKFRHSSIQDRNAVTTSLTRFLENLTLYICNVSRDDLIVGFMGEYQRRREKPFGAALVICGRLGKYQISDEVMDMLKGLKGAPVMIVDYVTSTRPS
jgi:hypothetical protein